MATQDIFLAAASLAAVLLFLLIGVGAALVIFTIGSPLVLLGGIMALGLAGVFLLAGIAAAVISAWYVVYAFLNEHFSEKKAQKPVKGDYTLKRIKKA
jgi:membrane protein implicated in regulation of membrane protease activity